MTVLAGDFNIPISVFDTTSRQKKKNQNNIGDLNSSTNQFDLSDMYKILQYTAKIKISFNCPRNVSQGEQYLGGIKCFKFQYLS